MSVAFRWVGLDELKRALANTPAELVEEGRAIVTSEGQAAYDEIAKAYEAHSRTHNLRKGLELRTRDRSGVGVGILVQSRAPHAHLFELGTQARHSKLGAARGSMPVGKIFVPAISRHRRAMYERLKGLLLRKGLRVTGAAG